MMILFDIDIPKLIKEGIQIRECLLCDLKELYYSSKAE